MSDIRKFRTLARNWEAFGDQDPLFGVLSDPAKMGGQWDVEEFFASGVAHVQLLHRRLADAGASFEPGSCLDFGCGVGRLTVPLAASFRHTVGVDVAGTMIQTAREHRPADARCEFVVNRAPHLGRFGDGSFDVVHSCLVLQHIPPEYTIKYIEEFFRVAKPGGLVVFQVPAVLRTESELTASYSLPDSAFAAQLEFVDAPALFGGGFAATIAVSVTNRSVTTWPADIPAGRHLCLGNHWLREDGTAAVFDDGRTPLPVSIEPGRRVEMTLKVQAPEAPGRYILEVDVVQEHVAWFAQKGSPVARISVDVASAVTAREVAALSPPDVLRHPVPSKPRPPLVRRLLRRLRGGTPTFEMHVVPRAEIEQVIQANGGQLLKAVDDNAAGPRWISYTYICRKTIE
jgi:2-polyprenyl-3-methyl-5-hydroxy-6-metoxy-1,4-benzoquinol methylase